MTTEDVVSFDPIQEAQTAEAWPAPTAGLWDYDDGDLSIYALDDGGSAIPLLQIHEDCDDVAMPFLEAKSNAILAAASKHMLEALINARETLRQICEGQHPDNVCCHNLREVDAAIAAAKGDR
jgi:hypothetical protein